MAVFYIFDAEGTFEEGTTTIPTRLLSRLSLLFPFFFLFIFYFYGVAYD